MRKVTPYTILILAMLLVTMLFFASDEEKYECITELGKIFIFAGLIYGTWYILDE
jgi:hypothetical protein